MTTTFEEPMLQDDPLALPRVLVVDDEPRIRMAIRACLETEGLQIGEASNGRSALDQMIETRPDVVILDLSMPDLDGLSTLRLMNGIVDKPMPRVIVLTAYGSISAASTAEECGAVAFLEKPLVPETLRDVVKRALHAPSRRTRARPRDPFDGADDRPDTGHLWFG